MTTRTAPYGQLGQFLRCHADRAARTICLRGGTAILILVLAGSCPSGRIEAAQLRAGVAKVDVTNRDAGPVNDPLFVKALVLTDGATTAVLVTVDAVAIAEIGPIRNEYLANVRSRLQQESGIEPAHVLINASHCHGAVCADIEDRTVQAVSTAWRAMVPVHVGAGVGREDRIMENRRLKLKDGREADVRHAYSLPPDEEVAGVGPVDPEIGILRLDTLDGKTLAVVFNFSCHPIQGVPGRGNTADISGFASQVIEENLGDGTVALFLQGCSGDINPVSYKDVDVPRNAEPLGNMLGLSTLRALRALPTRQDDRLAFVNRTLELPAADFAQRIAALEAEKQRLVGSLQGTSLNLKTFIPLVIKYNLSDEFPSAHAHRYLHERMLERDALGKLDAENRENLRKYILNILAMEEITRVQTNLALLRQHQSDLADSGQRAIDVEVLAVRIGEFVLVTFPGELSVQIGLNIKQRAPHELTFVSGCTNGYIYYAPTAEQLRNPGGAQEDCDCILAPEWQALFEDSVVALLETL